MHAHWPHVAVAAVAAVLMQCITCASLLLVQPIVPVSASPAVVYSCGTSVVATGAARLVSVQQAAMMAQQQMQQQLQLVQQQLQLALQQHAAFAASAASLQAELQRNAHKQAEVRDIKQQSADLRQQLRAEVASSADTKQQLAAALEQLRTLEQYRSAQANDDRLAARLQAKEDDAEPRTQRGNKRRRGPAAKQLAARTSKASAVAVAASAAAAAASKKGAVAAAASREVEDLTACSDDSTDETSEAWSADSAPVSRLKALNRALAEQVNSLTLVCRVCLDAPPSVLLQPCKHVCLCSGCEEKLRTVDHCCPICRSPIAATVPGVRL